MAPRLSKRQQRELDELQALGNNVSQDPSDEEPVKETITSISKKSGFSALYEPEESDHSEGEDGKQSTTKSKKHKKRKRKGDVATPSTPSNAPSPKVVSSPRPRNDQNTPKKTKGKGKGVAVTNDMDDLDKALAELSVKYPDLKNVTTTNSGLNIHNGFTAKQNALLSVSIPHLDSDAEMRKFFGSKVVDSSKSQTKQARNARAATRDFKSTLTKPQPGWWPPAYRKGLSIRLLSEDELSRKSQREGVVEKGERWWTVEYSKRYRSITKAFIDAVLSGDPERFYQILHKLPWHADTLLQLGEVYRHREEYSQSVDSVNRAIFTYEAAFIGSFTFTTGSNRLDFDCVENRPFYLAIARNVADSLRRGCVRSAFEFSRLLLSLDPYTDPQGAFLFLDCLALKAGMYDWFLDMWSLHDAQALSGNIGVMFNVTALPGWAYARALVLREKKMEKESEEALKDAIQAFPMVLAPLADKADISFSSDLRGHVAFRIHVDQSSLSTQTEANLHLLSHLYAARSSSIWKIPENAAWLKKVAVSVLPEFKSGFVHPFRQRFNTLFPLAGVAPNPALAYALYRHISLLDHDATRRLTSYIPKLVSTALNLSCDPLPPPTLVSQYDQVFFVGTEDVFAERLTRRKREIDARMQDHLRDVFDAHPELGEMFPGGFQHFLNQMRLMPDEVMEEIVRLQEGGEVDGAAGLGDGAGVELQGMMPGGLEAEEDLPVELMPAPDDNRDEDDDDDESDGDEHQPPMPFRIVRNLLNRFWGANPEPGSDSDDDEDVGGPARSNDAG